MLLVPQPQEQEESVKRVHRNIGHFGEHRMLDRLKIDENKLSLERHG